MKAKEGQSVESWVRQFEESQDQGKDARGRSERDRDYYDGNQLTDEEIATLNQRGQPPVVFNRVKPKIDSLLGFERKMRSDPKAFPRTPKHEQEADSITDAIRYVLDDQRYQMKRSEVAENLFVEGYGAAHVTVRKSRAGHDVVISHIPWDRYFYDPHSRMRDFSDKNYDGIVTWMDEADAVAQFGEEASKLVMQTLDTASESDDTFDDRPRKVMWADTKRKRVRVIQQYRKIGGKWHHAIYCRAGFLSGPEECPYKDEDGQPENCIVACSAYIDRDNNRYGVVRQMISPQDEINKRRSKALHYLNSRQVIAEEGAVNDIASAKRELAKPDGVVFVNPGMRFDVADPIQMAAGEMQLLQEAKNEIDASGVSPALEGDIKAPSGRAVEALQQAGLAEMAVVFDSLRDWNWRVYRAVWNRIRQFWTAERWVRVTDDEHNLRWVGLNVPQTDEYGAQVGMQNPVGELDVDIVLYDAPDSVNIQSEQFEMLVEMWTKAPDRIPLEAVIQASTLRNKEQLIEAIKKPEMPPEAQELQMRGATADVAGKEAKAAKDFASAEQIQMETQRGAIETQMAAEFGPPPPQ